jgi:hypothetical protein
VFCACEIIPLLSVVFCIFRAVLKFDFRLVMIDTPNKWRPVERKSCSNKDFLIGSVYFPRKFSYFNFNPFRFYVGPRPTLWFSCSRRFSWSLTLSNPIFLPPAHFPALIYFGRERSWWITCNYPTVLKEKNRNRKSTTCAICWLKSVLHEGKRREQENHNIGPIFLM